MPGGRLRRRWVKIYTSLLYSSLNYELTLAEQAVFIKLICLAGEYGQDGRIANGEGEAMPHEFIANRINAPVDVLESTIKKCAATNRINENSQGFTIVKWAEYQSEYDRQKPYRDAKRAGKKIPKKCPRCGWEGLTDETYCPICAETGRGTELEKDYGGGKFGHVVKR